MVELLLQPELWVAFATLLLLEVVLGIDNIVFISILANRLPESQQARARTIGLSLALVTRLLLLASLSWVIGLTAPLFTVASQEISGRDLILILGGLFLVAKATYEIHENLEGHSGGETRKTATFASVIAQILVLDVVFSLDSVITAVGMVDELFIMVAAVIVAMIIMLISAGAISAFVNQHPTVKMLALSFLLLIGGSLIAEGFDQHIPKGYVYGPIAFSVFVEFLNLRARARQERRKGRTIEPVHLHPTYVKQRPAATGPSLKETRPAQAEAGTTAEADATAGSTTGPAVDPGPATKTERA